MVEHAPCPVGVVKGRVGGLDRLLLCDSGVQEAPVVDQLVARLPDLVRGAREITVLHVMSQKLAGPTVPEGHELEAQAADLIAGQADAGRVLSHDQALLTKLGAAPRLKVRHGLVVPELAAEAEASDADLVNIGAHRGSGWRRILLSDLAHISWSSWIGRCWSCAPRATWSETWGRAEVELRRGVKRVAIVEPIAV